MFRLDDIELLDRELVNLDGNGGYERYRVTETGVSPMSYLALK